MDEKEEAEDTVDVCRICFDGAEAGPLLSPCQCRGTQGLVHEACLFRWRQLQTLQGKLSAARQCEICGTKYASSLSQPSRPLRAVVGDFGRVLLETLLGLGTYLQKSCSLSFAIFVGFPMWHFGVARVLAGFTIAFSSLVLMLYTKGMKLSVLEGPGNEVRLSLTCFGPPVDGLSSGMLLVSIRAGGSFHRTVLYVLEHHDFGSLALIVNKSLRGTASSPMNVTVDEDLNIALRDGGPVQLRAFFCIHNVESVPGTERLIRGEPIFLMRSRLSLQVLKSMAATQAESGSPPRQALIFKGVSSWGERQLEGELRRGTWGWIKPERVRPEDVLEMDPAALAGLWDRLIGSPHLHVFQG